MAIALFLAGCAPGETLGSGCGCGQSPNYGDAPGSEQQLVHSIDDRVFFDFAGSSLNVDSDATLNRQFAWLAKYRTVNILIAGNADERGTETYNLALGQRRANNVRDDLVAQGVAPARIQTISYGKDCPIALGHDDAAYQQNRTAITSVQGQNPQNCR